MKYRLRTGVDHEYKRKLIIGSILLILSILLLGISANILLDLRVSRTTGDTAISRTRQVNTQSSAAAQSNPNSSTNGGNTAPSSSSTTNPASAANQPRVKSYAQPSSANQPTTQQPSSLVNSLPVGGMGGSDDEQSCACSEVAPTPSAPILNPVLSPVLDTVDTTVDTLGGLLD